MDATEEVIIIGAGLSGLTLAYLLSKSRIKVTILEASGRTGGRIQTIRGKLDTPLELGATWFSDRHTNLLSLIDELGLEKFPQYSGGISLFQTKSFEPPQTFYTPASESPSYRIAGGTQKLVDTLCQKLPPGSIKTDSQVRSIRKDQDSMLISTSANRVYKAKRVVVCIPPQLAGTQIVFEPELPEAAKRLLPTVQTWMAGAIKFAIEYTKPFWREQGYSGMLYSHTGIITELYDHTNRDASRFAFTGFLNSTAAALPAEARQDLVLERLTELFGHRAENPMTYYDKIWTGTYLSTVNEAGLHPHQNNGHPLLQDAYSDHSLFFSGTETSAIHPGYMEGAVASANIVARKIATIEHKPLN